jgi:hypothetical protein
MASILSSAKLQLFAISETLLDRLTAGKHAQHRTINDSKKPGAEQQGYL